jgi:hypothetical protein
MSDLSLGDENTASKVTTLTGIEPSFEGDTVLVVAAHLLGTAVDGIKGVGYGGGKAGVVGASSTGVVGMGESVGVEGRLDEKRQNMERLPRKQWVMQLLLPPTEKDSHFDKVGVLGTSFKGDPKSVGVIGISDAGVGVYGTSNTGIGILADSSEYGVIATG